MGLGDRLMMTLQRGTTRFSLRIRFRLWSLVWAKLNRATYNNIYLFCHNRFASSLSLVFLLCRSAQANWHANLLTYDLFNLSLHRALLFLVRTN